MLSAGHLRLAAWATHQSYLSSLPTISLKFYRHVEPSMGGSFYITNPDAAASALHSAVALVAFSGEMPSADSVQ